MRIGITSTNKIHVTEGKTSVTAYGPQWSRDGPTFDVVVKTLEGHTHGCSDDGVAPMGVDTSTLLKLRILRVTTNFVLPTTPDSLSG